jgi:AraC-like DNA-binding protein
VSAAGRPGTGGFDSRLVAPPVHVDLWERATARFLVPMEIVASGRSIMGVIAGHRAGPASFCRLSATPHAAVRSDRLAGGPGAGHYKIAVGLHGRCAVTQHGRRVGLGPGDLTVYDTSEEYGVSGDVPFGLLVVLIPHDAVALTRDAVARVAATRLDGAELAAVRSGLLALAAGDPQAPPSGPVFDTVSRLVRRAAPARLQGPRDAAALLARAQEVIGQRLADPGLNPDQVAAVLGVSRRYLYDLFAADIGPVAHYTRTVRLERARDLLGSAADSGRSVADIAVECGLPDPAHFSRLFRRAYGVPPAAYRRSAAAGPPPA